MTFAIPNPSCGRPRRHLPRRGQHHFGAQRSLRRLFAEAQKDKPGNGMHINISARESSGKDVLPFVIAGIMNRICDMTVFLNTSKESYERLGFNKAPKYVSWSTENRSELIRIPAASKKVSPRRAAFPDPLCNPYIAFALIIYAGLEGIKNETELPEASDFNLSKAPREAVEGLKPCRQPLKAPKSWQRAANLSRRFCPRGFANAILNKENKIRQRREAKMELREQVYSLLIVSAAEKFNRSLSELLPENIYFPVKTVADVGSAKRELLERGYDLVIINTPFPTISERGLPSTSVKTRPRECFFSSRPSTIPTSMPRSCPTGF